MNEHHLQCIQSVGDADLLIVKTAIDSASNKTAVVIGEDTDLMILLLYHAKNSGCQIFFTSEQRPSCGIIKHTKSKLGSTVCGAILVVHALLKCDTTSRLFSIGKGVALQKFKKIKVLDT